MKSYFTKEMYTGNYNLFKKENDAEVYIKKDNDLVIMGYRSKRQVKPAFNYRYLTIKDRDNKITTFFARIKEIASDKQARRKERKSFKPNYKKGDIFYASWGYDQTNVDFVQVIKTTAKTVTVKEIGQKSISKKGYSGMSDFRTATKDNFIVDSYLTPDNENNKYVISSSNCFHIGSSRYFYPWDGEELYNSWYA
jgi:hypothetical protein